jgi:glycosyltransferase involved in cell wall biosynthesis
MEQEVRSSFGSKEVFVIPRGIEVPDWISEHKDLDRFVFVGRIEPNKGLDLCIEAMNLLATQNGLGLLTLDVVGEADPGYEKYCVSLIEKYGLQSRIRFLGKNTKIMESLAQYSVLLMPTMAQEAFGRVVIEAMSLGLIVLATDAYGPKEIITDKVDGFLFERGSVSALTAKIMAVAELDREQRCALGRKAKQKVLKKYEINLVKKKIEIILESIVNEPNKYQQ